MPDTMLIRKIIFLFMIIKACTGQSDCDNKTESIIGNFAKTKKAEWTKLITTIESAEAKEKPCLQSGCLCYSGQITRDLSFFQEGITIEEVEWAKQYGTLYQIINKKLYKEKECMFPSRCKGIEHFLLKIAKDLPDMEFVINTRDIPQIPVHSPRKAPVFSFSKTKHYADILYPAWSFWEGGPAINLYPTGLGRWDLHRKSLIEASNSYPWSKKLDKAFFRGSRTNTERDPLVRLSREDSSLVDAQYTKNQAWKSIKDTLNAEPVEEVRLEEHCKYKYLFNFRGVAASFRFKHLFLCKSLVFHVGDEWIEFFYPKMIPWVHYVPVSPKSTTEEIRSLLEFFKNNEAIAKKIANSGFKFIKKKLLQSDIYCYWNNLLQNYSQLLKYDVKKRPTVSQVL